MQHTSIEVILTMTWSCRPRSRTTHSGGASAGGVNGSGTEGCNNTGRGGPGCEAVRVWETPSSSSHSSSAQGSKLWELFGSPAPGCSSCPFGALTSGDIGTKKPPLMQKTPLRFGNLDN